MGRMTEKDASGRWQVKGLPWESLQEGQTITREASQILYGCLCRLKDYEGCGMGPCQLEGWHERLEDVAAYVCDKLCRHPREITEQEELDAICEGCPISAWAGALMDS